MPNNPQESSSESLGGETVESLELSDPESTASSFKSAESQPNTSLTIIERWRKLVEEIIKQSSR